MTLSDAIYLRTSVRSYLPDPVSPQQRRQLDKSVQQCNLRSGLRLRLLWDQPTPLSASYGLLTGVKNYLVLAGDAGDPDLEEKCGYYGEELVLTAAAMGLGTCWVGATYDKDACQALLEPGEKLVCAVAIGHAPLERSGREKLIRGIVRRKTKAPEELSQGLEGSPSWFSAGIEAVQYAPSARNLQGFSFLCRSDGAVQAQLTREGAFALVDLGIAKYHFELGAHGGTWTWGDGGVFRKAREEKSCGAAIWRSGQTGRQYLLARHNGGHWSFPKGHVEGTETEVETARREILEETGLHAQIDDGFRQVVTYYPMPGVIKDVVFFTAQPTGGTEHAQEEEIAQIGWFTFSEARERITFATDEEILLAAEDYLNGK